MKIVRCTNDLSLVLGYSLDRIAPLPGRLHRGLNGFHSGIHRQRTFVTGDIMQEFIECRKLVVAKCPARQGDEFGLFDERFENGRVAMSLVDGRIGGQAIEIFLAVDVGHPDSLPLVYHHVERTVVMRAVLFLEGDVILSLHRYTP